MTGEAAAGEAPKTLPIAPGRQVPLPADFGFAHRGRSLKKEGGRLILARRDAFCAAISRGTMRLSGIAIFRH